MFQIFGDLGMKCFLVLGDCRFNASVGSRPDSVFQAPLDLDICPIPRLLPEKTEPCSALFLNPQ